MQQPKSYTPTLSEGERQTIVSALAFLFPQIRGEFFISSAEFLNLSRRFLEMKPDAVSAREQSGTAAAKAVAAPSTPAPSPLENAPADLWAPNKEGTRVPPAEFETLNLVITGVKLSTKTTSSGAKFWKVDYRGGKANCFDEAISGKLLALSHRQDVAKVHVTRNGAYTNIVGIRA